VKKARQVQRERRKCKMRHNGRRCTCRGNIPKGDAQRPVSGFTRTYQTKAPALKERACRDFRTPLCVVTIGSSPRGRA
jgi:hypothetical protein